MAAHVSCHMESSVVAEGGKPIWFEVSKARRRSWLTFLVVDGNRSRVGICETKRDAKLLAVEVDCLMQLIAERN